MALSNNLLTQFAKSTNDNTQTKKESTAYGQIKTIDGINYVQLDGSELLTPITSTTVVNDGDRVMVTIKNHTAIVTGDITNPSANNKDVVEIGNKITDVEILVADKVTTQDIEAINAYIENIKGVTAKYEELNATTAEIETLQSKYANMEYITAKDAEMINAEIESLKGKFAEFTSISAQDLEVINAELTNIVAYNATFTYVSAEKLEAIDADIKYLKVNTMNVENADIRYAQIDFSNIKEAAIEKLFTDSGIIENLVMSEGKVTGRLVGVTIKGDLIEGNTVKADKLVILGEDGLYYKLNVNALGETTASSDEKYQNGLDGSIIIAKSITADRIDVTDLVAFGATIGGFHITNDSLYSGTKDSIDNSTEGVYIHKDGQLNIGDSNQYIKYYLDADGERHLEIIANSIKLDVDSPTIGETIEDTNQQISDLNIKAEGIDLTITDIKATQQTTDETIENLQTELVTLTNTVSTKVSSDELSILIQSQINQNGVDKVATSTGYTFDENGLTISKSGTGLSTTVDEDGMNIIRDDIEVLNADSDGVTAYNLHARTYLIIGETSRFEDYIKNGKKRTGCFWVGGNQ